MIDKTIGWNLENSYAQLPELFFRDALPAKFREPKVAILNLRFAIELGLDFSSLTEFELAAMLSGQTLPPGAKPIAQAYAGHQYGGFTMLGDGRAILLGEQRTPAGKLIDIQLKGAGRTPFSRMGDGLAAVGPMLREYIISEAMHALRIPTTRSLAVVTTGEPVYREDTLPGAVLVRTAASHIRVGTFEYIGAQQDETNLRKLADYTIVRHYPELIDAPEKYVGFLQAVLNRQAALIAQWQMVGFVHGVMNTDNVSICGETIDYGPCAFMDTYNIDTVFSSIDRGGRYAYGNQAKITQWNMTRFAESLLPLLHKDQQTAIEIATAELHRFMEVFDTHWLNGMRQKIGLTTTVQDDDKTLIERLLKWMQDNQADFTNTFADLSQAKSLTDDKYMSESFQEWLNVWQTRLKKEALTLNELYHAMQKANPLVIPRNHRVEQALAAANAGDFSVMQKLLEVLSNPFDYSCDIEKFREPPPPGTCYKTFCGT